MLKRVTWFVSGAIAGIAGARFAKRKVRETAAQLAPPNIAKTAAAKVREKGHDVADAVRDGRHAMHAKETELRAKLDGQADDHDRIIVIEERSTDTSIVGIEVGDEEAGAEPEGAVGDERAGPRRRSRRRARQQ